MTTATPPVHQLSATVGWARATKNLKNNVCNLSSWPHARRWWVGTREQFTRSAAMGMWTSTAFTAEMGTTDHLWHSEWSIETNYKQNWTECSFSNIERAVV